MQRRLARLTGASLALVFGLAAGCGPSAESDTTEPSPPPTTSTADSGTTADSDHNRGDVEFAQQMVPHHEQAVVAADLALERASSPQIEALAQRIKSTQDSEKDQLLALLRLWGEKVTPGGATGDHDHSRLMSEETFQQLQEAAPAEFDELWLRSMVEHHRGAVELANVQLRDGSDSLATMYSQGIVDRQSQELKEMATLLRTGTPQ